jgi:periplasmic divalent cation tolerance protein
VHAGARASTIWIGNGVSERAAALLDAHGARGKRYVVSNPVIWRFHGERIARALVEERLAACVNVVPGLRSVYRWQGAVETADEALLLVKTREAALERVAARVRALHPYTLPEIVALPLVSGLAAYLEWIDDGVA